MCVAKEIQLQHRAAVVSVAVTDRAMQLLGSALGGQLSGAKQQDMSGSHHVVICSEQQIKVWWSRYCMFSVMRLFGEIGGTTSEGAGSKH